MKRAVLQAGSAVMKRFRKEVRSWQKEDASPVSEADHEANNILYEYLVASHDISYGYLSEESSDDKKRLHAERTWIVDPIDGTRAFLRGDPHFTICVALIEGDKALTSAVYNPATEEFFEATAGQGAKLNDEVLSTSPQCSLENCTMLGNKQMFEHKGWPQSWPAMRIEQRNSTNYRLALVATGQFDASLAIARKADWDLAPGALIAQEAGALVSDHTGAEYRYNREEPAQRSLVCAAPGLYTELFNRVSHLPANFTDKPLQA
jgi:myo-inositol-1(or 4)-monophosphatase